jgi:hypothetical protein
MREGNNEAALKSPEHSGLMSYDETYKEPWATRTGKEQEDAELHAAQHR